MNLARDASASHFTDEQCGAFEHLNRAVRIQSALEAEGGICAQSEAPCRATDPCGIEASRLEEDVRRGRCHARIESTKYATDTHRFLGVADHQIVGCECAFYAVERRERRACRHGANLNPAASDLRRVKGVQRLTKLVQDVIRHVHHVVDRSKANGRQSTAQPLGALADGHAADRQAGVTWAALGVDGLDDDGRRWVVDAEAFGRWALERYGSAPLLEVGGQVAGHAVVRRCIDAVRRDVDLQHVVRLDLIVFRRGQAHGRVSGQDDDAVVARTDADLIFGADHAERLLAAYLAFLDYKLLVAVIELCADHGHDNHLSGRHVRCATDDLQRFVAAHIDRSQVQMIRIGVRRAGQHATRHESCQSTADGLHRLYAARFESDGRQRRRHLVRRQVERQIIP